MTKTDANKYVGRPVWTVPFINGKPDYKSGKILKIVPGKIVDRSFYNSQTAFWAETEPNVIELFPIGHCYTKKKLLQQELSGK